MQIVRLPLLAFLFLALSPSLSDAAEKKKTLTFLPHEFQDIRSTGPVGTSPPAQPVPPPPVAPGASTAAAVQNATQQATIAEQAKRNAEVATAMGSNLNFGEASIDDPANAQEILAKTLGATFGSANVTSPSFYCFIHVLRWSDPGSEGIQKVAKEHWYVFRGGLWEADRFEAHRLYGTTRAWLLYVHLNLGPKVNLTSYQPNYLMVSTSRTPAPEADLQALLGLFPGLDKKEAGGPQPHNVWGGGSFDILNPSDIALTPAVTYQPAPTEAGTPSGASFQSGALGDAAKYDNEGFYWWDASVGIPIRGIKDLTVDQTTHTAVPAHFTRAQAFGMFDLYLRPVDLGSNGFSQVPHLIAGVTITDRPLNKFLVGVGWGPALADFYGGYMWVRIEDQTSTTRRYDHQFAFGVNVSVKTAIAKFKAATK